MQETLDFIKNAVGTRYHSPSSCEHEIQVVQGFKAWIALNQGRGALQLIPGNKDMSMDANGVYTLVDGHRRRVAGKDFKVFNMAEALAEHKDLFEAEQESHELLRFYTGDAKYNSTYAALKEYREAAATLGRAQRNLHERLEDMDGYLVENIDEAVFAESGIVADFLQPYYWGDD